MMNAATAPDSENTARRAYSPSEVAAMLGISNALMYRSIKHGEIAAVKVGGRVLIPSRAIADLLGENN